MTTAVLATASASVALALCGYPWAATAGSVFVVAMLTFGWVSLRHATRRAGQGSPQRVAAVVVDGKPPEDGGLAGTWPAESPEYRDVEGTLVRYQPYVEEAARQGATVIALPEVSFYAGNEAAAERWSAGVQSWARALDVAIVAPFFDAEVPRNTLAVIDKSGVVAYHDKQHPARGLSRPAYRGGGRPSSPGQQSRTIDGHLRQPRLVRYGRSARRAGALLAVPVDRLVRRLRGAPPAEALSGLRSSQVFPSSLRWTGRLLDLDGAGRVLIQQSSADGRWCLVADVRS